MSAKTSPKPSRKRRPRRQPTDDQATYDQDCAVLWRARLASTS